MRKEREKFAPADFRIRGKHLGKHLKSDAVHAGTDATGTTLPLPSQVTGKKLAPEKPPSAKAAPAKTSTCSDPESSVVHGRARKKAVTYSPGDFRKPATLKSAVNDVAEDIAAKQTASDAVPASPLRAKIANTVANVVHAVSNVLRMSPTRPSLPRPRMLLSSPLSLSSTSSRSESLSSPETLLAASDLAEDEIQPFFEHDYEARGDGGYSDEEGEEIEAHSDVVRPGFLLSSRERATHDGIDVGDVAPPAHDTIRGSPNSWFLPAPPPGWSGYTPKHDAPLAFEDVDNPAGWSDFTFTPMYDKGKYLGHSTPNGAQVVPENKNGERVVDGYTFHYRGYMPDAFDVATYNRTGAKYGDLKPDSRKGKLDESVLREHGLTEERIINDDALFFLQMLLPICDPKKSGIEGNDRMPFYSVLRPHSNTYVFGEKGWGGGYGHTHPPTNEAELVNFSGVPLRHGARGGNPATLHTRWMQGDPDFDKLIANNVAATRFRQLKSILKLNNNLASPKVGEDNYDPACKYDWIYKAVCHNMNYCTESADMDAAADETTWGFGGYSGDCGGRVKGKPGKAKGESRKIFCERLSIESVRR